MAASERLDALHAVDVCFCVQRAERRAAQIADAESAGNRGSSRLVRGCAQDMVEDHRAHSAMHVSGRTFVGGAKSELGPYQSTSFVVDRERRGDWVAQTDHNVAPGHRLTIVGLSHTERN